MRSPLVAVLAGGVLLLGVGFGSGFAVGRHHPAGGAGPAAVSGFTGTGPGGTGFNGQPPQGQFPQSGTQGQIPQSGAQGQPGSAGQSGTQEQSGTVDDGTGLSSTQ